MHHTNRVRQGQNYVMTGGFEIYVVDMFLTKQEQHWRPTVIAEIVNVKDDADQETIGKIVTLDHDEFDTLNLDDTIPLVQRGEQVKQVTTTAKKPSTRRKTTTKKAGVKTAKKPSTRKKAATTE